MSNKKNLKNTAKKIGKENFEGEIRILIPLLSKQENNEFFLESIPREAEEIILLLVVDTELMPGQFGFAASDIAVGNVLMEQLKKFFIKKRRKCIELEEWGNTERKILQTAQLKQVDTIFFVKQNNEFYRNLLQQIQQNTKIAIEEIELPKHEETKKQGKSFQRFGIKSV